MKLTPRQFTALRKRRDAEHQRQELLCGIIAANVANFSLCRLETPAAPADFMPSQAGKRDAGNDLVALHNSIVNQKTLTQGTTRIG